MVRPISPVSVADAPEQRAPVDYEVASLIGSEPVKRFGPYKEPRLPSYRAKIWQKIQLAWKKEQPESESLDVPWMLRVAGAFNFDVNRTLDFLERKGPPQTASELVSDLRWNSVVPLPIDSSNHDIIYFRPSRIRARLPLQLVEYAAQCLYDRHRNASTRPLTLLISLKEWKIDRHFDIEDWVKLLIDFPRSIPVASHKIVLVHTAASQDFPTLWLRLKRALWSREELGVMPEWLHVCADELGLHSHLPPGCDQASLPNDLGSGKLPIYRLVEGFIHYRQTLEGILERRQAQIALLEKNAQQLTVTPRHRRPKLQAEPATAKMRTYHQTGEADQQETPKRSNCRRGQLRKHVSLTCLKSEVKAHDNAMNEAASIRNLKHTPKQRRPKTNSATALQLDRTASTRSLLTYSDITAIRRSRPQLSHRTASVPNLTRPWPPMPP
eukprot:scaffold4743_cov171-Amphora_coffeaeformis.AAC.20